MQKCHTTCMHDNINYFITWKVGPGKTKISIPVYKRDHVFILQVHKQLFLPHSPLVEEAWSLV